MARTHGHGNPDWTRDETVLALALYFEAGEEPPSRHDARVRELSELLRNMPYHAGVSKRDSFRNPDGVAFKLQNLHNVATGKGLGNVSEMDRRVWREFGTRPEETKSLAKLIRSAIKPADDLGQNIDADADEEFLEGRLLTSIHKRREREPRLRKRLLAARLRSGELACDLCDTRLKTVDPAFKDAIFEAHHTVSISGAGERTTRIRDLALLCANCHRLIHRAIAKKKRWLSIEECRLLIGF